MIKSTLTKIDIMIGGLNHRGAQARGHREIWWAEYPKPSTLQMLRIICIYIYIHITHNTK